MNNYLFFRSQADSPKLTFCNGTVLHRDEFFPLATYIFHCVFSTSSKTGEVA